MQRSSFLHEIVIVFSCILIVRDYLHDYLMRSKGSFINVNSRFNRQLHIQS